MPIRPRGLKGSATGFEPVSPLSTQIGAGVEPAYKGFAVPRLTNLATRSRAKLYPSNWTPFKKCFITNPNCFFAALFFSFGLFFEPTGRPIRFLTFFVRGMISPLFNRG